MYDKLHKIALRSPHKRYAMGCIIVTKDHQISGWAHTPTARLRSAYSLHAEMHALARGRHEDLHGATAWVGAWAKKSGNHTNACPCLDCMIALAAAGVKKVVFTYRGHAATFVTTDIESMLEVYQTLKVYPGRIR